MGELPRVRWMVWIAAMVYVGRYLEVDGALIGAGILAAVKMAQEFANKIDQEDPYVHTMGRDGKTPGFWGRVL